MLAVIDSLAWPLLPVTSVAPRRGRSRPGAAIGSVESHRRVGDGIVRGIFHQDDQIAAEAGIDRDRLVVAGDDGNAGRRFSSRMVPVALPRETLNIRTLVQQYANRHYY